MIDDMNDANDVELRTGREGPSYTEVHDWVALSGVSMTALGLYNLLRMHVNRKRGDRYVWLSTLTLAIMCGLSRGDKLKPYLDELEKLGAIDIDRTGLHRRNIYTVHSLPPTGYRGPLDIKDWHERNKAKLDAIRDAEKAKRDARRAKQRAGKDQVNPVTPGRGEQNVTPKSGEPVHPETGGPVAPPRGREPKEAQPKEVEPSVPPSEVRRSAIEESIRSKDAVQSALIGEDKNLAPKGPSCRDVAMGIARGWIGKWNEANMPMIMRGKKSDPLHAVASSVLPALECGYTETEVKFALMYLNDPFPYAPTLTKALVRVRSGWRPPKDWKVGGPIPAQGRGGSRGPVVDVNEAWDDVVQPAKAGANVGGGW